MKCAEAFRLAVFLASPVALALATAAVFFPSPGQTEIETVYAGSVKLDSSGKPIPQASGPWACVTDKLTGLTWENKSVDQGVHHAGWTYTWRALPATRLRPGGQEGSCTGLTRCDTAALVERANAARRCGFADWRLPTLPELQTLLDRSLPEPGPLICDCLFPHTQRSSYWTRTRGEETGHYGLNFQNGATRVFPDQASLFVRLVRGGEQR